MKKELILELINQLVANETDQSALSPKPDVNGDIRIAILQRGWIYIGRFHYGSNECRLEDANCIRNWGTTKGLGELASCGPTSNTKLDKCPTVRFHPLTIVATIDVDQKIWAKNL